MNKTLDSLSDFGVTIHELLRYGYGGFLVYLTAALIEPDYTKTVVESLGTTITVLLAFAVGGTIYIGHRPIVGELLYLLHEKVHICVSQKSKGYTCRSAYFVKEFGLPLHLATEAYRTVRDDTAFNQAKQRRFYLQHSELHTLYVTFFILLIGACIVWICKPADSLVSGFTLLAVALFSLLSGFVGNILLCRQECKTLLLIPDVKIKELLKEAQFITENIKEVATAEQADSTDQQSAGR